MYVIKLNKSDKTFRLVHLSRPVKLTRVQNTIKLSQVGRRGLPGEAGQQGNPGPKGDKGDTGATGPTGPPNVLSIGTVTGGDEADASITGTSPEQELNLVLPKGDKGDTGAQGPQGNQGPAGATGPQGVKGDKGDTGNTGATGATGPAGATGPTGPQGEKGDPGDQGPQGEPGEDGVVQSIVAGTNVTVDDTDPANPIVSASGGGGAVDSVNGQTGEVVLDADDIDDTSTTHKFATEDQLSKADNAVQPEDLATVATTGEYDDLEGKPTIPTVPGTKNSIEEDGGDLQLVGDSATPGNSKLYGTNGSGVKGWYNQSGGGGGGQVDSVVAGTGIDVDATDPVNPEVSLDAASQASLAKADTAIQADDLADVATSGSYNDLEDVPTEFTPSAHTHVEADITDLDKYTQAEVDTLLAGKVDTTEVGANNGVAELDGSGKVPSAQLPSFVDDVIEAANFAALPGTGESGKIYVTLDDNKTYRWGGSSYVEISESLALGETSTTAYRGDRGKTAYDHSQDVTTNPHNVTKTQVGLPNVSNDAQLKIASNLSDLNSASAARTNLGLGALATQSTIGDGDISATADVLKGVLGLQINGGGSAITTGFKGYIHVPYNCTIVKWILLGVTAGSCTIDIWKDTYANYPPTVADTIIDTGSGGVKPAIAASGVKAESTSLANWTTTLSQGDVLGINVDALSGLTELQVLLEVRKT